MRSLTTTWRDLAERGVQNARDAIAQRDCALDLLRAIEQAWDTYIEAEDDDDSAVAFDEFTMTIATARSLLDGVAK